MREGVKFPPRINVPDLSCDERYKPYNYHICWFSWSGDKLLDSVSGLRVRSKAYYKKSLA